MANFPKHFIWGAASASYQVEGAVNEGGRTPSIWDRFSHTPGRVCRNENGDFACDSFHRVDDDVEALKSMGLRAYRFSISWPRIVRNGYEEVNEEGFTYYDELIDKLLQNDIEPYATLFHWDLPLALEDKGGWKNIETAKHFERYATIVAEHFKGKVKNWFTINEPACIVGLGYGQGIHAPGLKLSEEEQFICWQNIIYAHSLASKALRAVDPNNKISIASTGRICYPISETEDNIRAASELTFVSPDGDWTFTHQMALDPICLGRWPEEHVGEHLKTLFDRVPNVINDSLKYASPDYIGLNIYNGAPVKMGSNGPLYLERETGYPRTALGWPIEEACLNWGPRFIYERYKKPIYITENGLSCNDRIYLDGKVHDADRIDFMHRYLLQLSEASKNGADVQAYFHWSLLDNFEWHSGYNERFGLYYVNYNDFSRTAKDSALWYKEVVKDNGENL